MEKQIFKYTIDLEKREQVVLMPEYTEILSVQLQQGNAKIWALVDQYAKEVPRRFCVFLTGAEIEKPDDMKFLATIQLHGGAIVLHVFEKVR